MAQLADRTLLPTGVLVGNALVLYAALCFAGVHAIAKALYKDGLSVVTLLIMRGVIVFLLNAVVALAFDGPSTAFDVVMLRRIQSRRTFWLAVLRGFVGAAGLLFLHLSLRWLSLADSFTLFLGIGMVATIVISRCIFGAAEQLGLLELVCVSAIFGGILLVAQPPILFSSAGAAPRVSALGLLVTALAAVLDNGIFNVLTRVLAMRPDTSAAKGTAATAAPPSSAASPAALISIHMAVFTLFFLGITLAASRLGLAVQHEWRWLRWTPPTSNEWLLIASFGSISLTSQLANVAGYARTRAGVAVALSMSELIFAKMLDVVVLNETTNALAGIGTAIVFF